MPFNFLNLPAELRLDIYDLVFDNKDLWAFNMRRYVTHYHMRTRRIKYGKKRGQDVSRWETTKPLGSRALMATCRQVYEESRVVLYGKAPLYCEWMSEFSAFFHSFCSHFLPQLTGLAGLKRLEMFVRTEDIKQPDDWETVPLARGQKLICHWRSKAKCVEALKTFAEACDSLLRVDITEAYELNFNGMNRLRVVPEFEEASVEINGYIRNLRLR